MCVQINVILILIKILFEEQLYFIIKKQDFIKTGLLLSITDLL